MIVCHCKVVNDRAVRAAIDAGATTLGGVCRATGAGTVCGGCVPGVRSLLMSYGRPEAERHLSGLASRLTALRTVLEPIHEAA